MKCYTINNFALDELKNSFSFQKTYKKSGIQINDPTINTGHFQVIEVENCEEIILKLNVD